MEIFVQKTRYPGHFAANPASDGHVIIGGHHEGQKDG
jgi:hypothetical protein